MKLEIAQKKETEQINEESIKSHLFNTTKDILKSDPLNIIGLKKSIRIEKEIQKKNNKIVNLVSLNNKAKEQVTKLQKELKSTKEKNKKLHSILINKLGIA